MMNKLKFPICSANDGQKLFLISGPCVIEDRELMFKTAEELKKLSEKFNITMVFKASFDKANRSSIKSFRGPGLDEGLKLLAEIKKKFELPLLSDVHHPEMISACSEVLDIIQIPAFLARQTDFYIEAGKVTNLINVKKGQFMAPKEMINVVDKYVESGGNKDSISITERGTFFGYGNLVVDFRSINTIKDMGVQYIYDGTHSLQLPGGQGSSSGGQRHFLESLILAQIAGGANGLFIESHPNPDEAKSDPATQYPLHKMDGLLEKITRLYESVKSLS